MGDEVVVAVREPCRLEGQVEVAVRLVVNPDTCSEALLGRQLRSKGIEDVVVLVAGRELDARFKVDGRTAGYSPIRCGP